MEKIQYRRGYRSHLLHQIIAKVSFFCQCSKMQLIPLKKFNLFYPITLVFQIKMLI